MAAHEPDGAQRRWAELFMAGDLDGLAALYEPEAALAVQPGQVVTGAAAIREALGGFLAMRQTFELEVKRVVRAGDLALLHSSWTLTGTGPDGQPLSLSGTTADVARRQSDGTWRFVIDNPWGTA
jgi:uncharacterized protein (TIGR02246 family)